MPFIKFLADHTVKAVNGATYRKGDVVECSASSAEHFTRRDLAVVCEDPELAKRRSKPYIDADVEDDLPAKPKRTKKKDATED